MIQNQKGNTAIIVTIIVAVVIVIGTGLGVYQWQKAAVAKKETESSARIEELQDKIIALQEKSEDSSMSSVTGKDIKKEDFTKIIETGSKIGSFLDALYGDLTDDGENEALIQFVNEGTGKYLDTYVYGYRGGELKQLFKKENLYKGSAKITDSGDSKVLSITYVDLESDVNTAKPNSDLVSTSDNYKWDGDSFEIQ